MSSVDNGSIPTNIKNDSSFNDDNNSNQSLSRNNSFTPRSLNDNYIKTGLPPLGISRNTSVSSHIYGLSRGVGSTDSLFQSGTLTPSTRDRYEKRKEELLKELDEHDYKLAVKKLENDIRMNLFHQRQKVLDESYSKTKDAILNRTPSVKNYNLDGNSVSLVDRATPVEETKFTPKRERSVKQSEEELEKFQEERILRKLAREDADKKRKAALEEYKKEAERDVDSHFDTLLAIGGEYEAERIKSRSNHGSSANLFGDYTPKKTSRSNSAKSKDVSNIPSVKNASDIFKSDFDNEVKVKTALSRQQSTRKIIETSNLAYALTSATNDVDIDEIQRNTSIRRKNVNNILISPTGSAEDSFASRTTTTKTTITDIVSTDANNQTSSYEVETATSTIIDDGVSKVQETVVEKSITTETATIDGTIIKSSKEEHKVIITESPSVVIQEPEQGKLSVINSTINLNKSEERLSNESSKISSRIADARRAFESQTNANDNNLKPTFDETRKRSFTSEVKSSYISSYISETKAVSAGASPERNSNRLDEKINQANTMSTGNTRLMDRLKNYLQAVGANESEIVIKPTRTRDEVAGKLNPEASLARSRSRETLGRSNDQVNRSFTSLKSTEDINKVSEKVSSNGNISQASNEIESGQSLSSRLALYSSISANSSPESKKTVDVEYIPSGVVRGAVNLFSDKDTKSKPVTEKTVFKSIEQLIVVEEKSDSKRLASDNNYVEELLRQEREEQARIEKVQLEEQRKFEESKNLRILQQEELAKAKLEKEATERVEKEAREKAEQEAREKAEQEAREKAEQEAREKAEQEAREKAEQEAKEKAEKEAKLKFDQEAREKAEQEAKLKFDQEAKEKAEREAKEKAEESLKIQQLELKEKYDSVADARISFNSSPIQSTIDRPSVAETIAENTQNVYKANIMSAIDKGLQDLISPTSSSYISRPSSILSASYTSELEILNRRQILASRKEPSLYLINGKRRIYSTRILLNSELNINNVYFLIVPKKNVEAEFGIIPSTIYLFTGSKAPKVLKARGKETAINLADKDFNRKSTILDVEEKLENSAWKEFRTLATGKITDTDFDANEYELTCEANFNLWALSEDKKEWVCINVTGLYLSRDILARDHCFVLDTGNDIYYWQGKSSLEVERQIASDFAKYLGSNRNNDIAHVMMELDNMESTLFREKLGKFENRSVSLEVKQLANIKPKDWQWGVYDRGSDHKTNEKIVIGHMYDPPPPPATWDSNVVDGEEILDYGGPPPPELDRGCVELKVWLIQGKEGMMAIQEKERGVFYSAESYLILYRHLTGREGNEREVAITYFWIGNDSKSTDSGAAAYLATTAIDRRLGARQLRVVQGKEQPHFLSIFRQPIIVKSGSRNDKPEEKSLFQVKGTRTDTVRTMEVPFTAVSVSSVASFIVTSKEKVYVYYGEGSFSFERNVANEVAQRLADDKQVVICDESKFLKNLPGERWSDAFLAQRAQHEGVYDCRLFRTSHIINGAPTSEEFAPFIQNDLQQNGVFILDCFFDIYVWAGEQSQQKDLVLALSTALEYAEFVQKKQPERKLNSEKVRFIKSGEETLCFRLAFLWFFEDDKKSQQGGFLSKLNLARRKIPAPVDKDQSVSHLLDKITYTTYSVEVLKNKDNLPMGVDPTSAEMYLNEKDFNNLFNMNRDAFKSLPKWKQSELKKKVGFF